MMNAAKSVDLPWCAEAVKACETLDRRMKSEGGLDAEGELKLLLVRLTANRSGNRVNAWGGG